MEGLIAGKYITREAAAQYLGCSLSTLDRLRKMGEITGRQFGLRRIVFDPADLDAYIMRQSDPLSA